MRRSLPSSSIYRHPNQSRLVVHISAKDLETIGTWGIYIFTILNAFGLVSQICEMHQLRSGKSIPVGSNLFVMGLFGASFIYGLSAHRPPIVFNSSILGLGFGLVVIGLWKYKGFKIWEYVFGLGLLAALIGMLLTGHHALWYLGFNIGAATSLTLQPIEIWRNRSAGAVNIWTLLLFELSNIFWVVYGYAIHDRVLMFVCPAYVIIMFTSIVLWFVYRPGTNHHDQKLSHKA